MSPHPTRRWILLACLLSLPQIALADVRPVESTLAHELMQLERDVGTVPDETAARLDRIVRDASDAAIAIHRRPRSRDEALAVLQHIQIALAKHNLFQPLRREDWPMRMSTALTPLDVTPEQKRNIVERQASPQWGTYADLDAPFFYVDCDMGAQLFLAVGQRAGWDIRLAEVPDHNFVRWHLPGGETVNWDWTAWSSLSDDAYRSRIAPAYDPRLQAHYVRSFTPEETRAYYRGLVASQIDENSDRIEHILVDALRAFPNHPTLLNNTAWFYATHPGIPASSRDRALPFALAAWSLKWDNANIADTAGCSAAAAEQWGLARQIQTRAVELAPDSEAYRANLQRISKQELCAR